jgi:mannose-6-phosphate isomerase-like protein (cupin superfamily)
LTGSRRAIAGGFCFARSIAATGILRRDGRTEYPKSRASGGPNPWEDQMEKVNIAEKFSRISEYWKPYVAAELNGQHVKLDKLKGDFVFHHHENEDEMFLVMKGRFRMEFLDRHEWIEAGEFIVVPRGVEHRPVADEECWILLFEPASTLNTGNVRNERTLSQLEHV